MPRRKYGRLRKNVELPPKENCSRCRSGKYCPIPGHSGQEVKPRRNWLGPEKISKRKGKKN
ncbi:MAG: hypothetical protein CL978_06305 [Euryarchaeota archaeon]|jgi:hypothetical protein|nr:hypothetical protein [Euryarchaeota archaeon]|tara:strand:- start:2178 stop:2360 length:183 start_codon:yes stop_codon:yes gene_type:complete